LRLSLKGRIAKIFNRVFVGGVCDTAMEGPQHYSDGGCDWQIGCRCKRSFYYQPIPFCRGLR